MTDFDRSHEMGIPPMPSSPEYLTRTGVRRDSTLLEDTVQGLLTANSTYVRREVKVLNEDVTDPIQNIVEMEKLNGIIGNEPYGFPVSVIRNRNLEGVITEITLLGFKQGNRPGALWTDIDGTLWHYPRLSRERPFPRWKLFIVTSRLKRVMATDEQWPEDLTREELIDMGIIDDSPEN